MERNGLQKCTVLGYKNSNNRYPQNRLITEFTHLFVDIKHMRPVTEVPVADLTFWFNEGSIYL